MVSHALRLDGSNAGQPGSAGQLSSSHEQLPLLSQAPCDAGFTAVAREASSAAAAAAFGSAGGRAADHQASSAGDAGSYAEEYEEDEDCWASGSHASSSDTFSEVGDPAATEVVYVREGVAVWPSHSRRILGRLSLQLAAVRARAAPPPLSSEELASFLDGDGRLVDEAGFRERVFQAGIEPTARREAWKWLLGVYPAGSSSAQRQQQRLRQQQQYALLQGQWAAVGPEQARRWGKWRERRSRIDKDVARTDRLHPFYRGRDAPQHLAALRDVLRCYCLFNWDLGYCQGMSDLASPLLVAMEGDEVDAFWCFVGLMERMAGNFAQDQAGMHTQLAALRQLVQVLDPQLHALFEARECLNYFFAFRWLLIHFKREFPFDQVLCLWEACWACPLTPHLHLYLAAAVLIQHRRLLLTDPALDFDGLLRFCVGLAGRLELGGCLRLAEALALIAGQAGQELLAGLP
ncbi:hypothetical protein OEZ85_009138 [Tetradesmus obliquus]|uniref:Rab-GAP TBC domain-containing protein n=1 Tax=Tetradesmus obliquus TaxID=3088 RepID=A0ABY8TL43_TETOB|nr:hypothetical protein OEZ85_009138 [Tetradesmus obliquus]